MGGRKQPTPVQTNQVRPDPPPAPPRKRAPVLVEFRAGARPMGSDTRLVVDGKDLTTAVRGLVVDVDVSAVNRVTVELVAPRLDVVLSADVTIIVQPPEGLTLIEEPQTDGSTRWRTQRADTAYMPVPRCETCKWWEQWPDESSVGSCGLLEASSGSKPVVPLARVEFSDADFGCVQYEAK